MANQDQNPLGQMTVYPTEYAPELLFPIPRKASRELLGLGDSVPFFGSDIWTAYELSWLNLKGKPQVALAEFVIPCVSPFIIESKSFKLYLNSFNQSRFDSKDEVISRLQDDLSKAAVAMIDVKLFHLDQSPLQHIQNLPGLCLDDVDMEIYHYQPTPDLLHCDATLMVSETLYSNLLKSNCPVTGQPDWATLVIEYAGAKINHKNLLAYIISFRDHQDFHEHCVERIFCDIQQRCKPQALTVYARYTRRGGLDINPYRSTNKGYAVNSMRLIRQ